MKSLLKILFKTNYSNMKLLLCKHSHKNTIINSNYNFKFNLNHASRTIKALSNRFFQQNRKGKCKTRTPVPSVHYKYECKTNTYKLKLEKIITECMIKRN